MGKEKKSNPGLNDKQKRFVSEYLKDLNATQAAIRAGYSKKTAGITGFDLLRNPKIAQEIANQQQKRAQRTEITQDKVLTELARMGFANLADYVAVQPDGSAVVDLSRATREQWAAVQEIVVDEYVEGRGAQAREVKRTKIKLHPKTSALELIGKHLGMFADKIDAKIRTIIDLNLVAPHGESGPAPGSPSPEAGPTLGIDLRLNLPGGDEEGRES